MLNTLNTHPTLTRAPRWLALLTYSVVKHCADQKKKKKKNNPDPTGLREAYCIRTSQLCLISLVLCRLCPPPPSFGVIVLWLLPRCFGRSQLVHWQINGASSSPASAAHKGRILCEKLSSVLGLQPPMGVAESEATQGVIGELVWCHAAYQIKLFSRPARRLHNWHE